MLGITVTVIGLILHLTAAVVGRGAIYDWVFDLCWLLAAPIVVWLVRSWRGVIFGRIEALPSKGPLLQKIVAHRSGPRAFVAALAGGLYLLGAGLRRYAVRQAGQLDTTRKLLAYLFRREVAKQAEARSHRNRLRERIDAQAHPRVGAGE